jgi:hypothetical protein
MKYKIQKESKINKLNSKATTPWGSQQAPDAFYKHKLKLNNIKSNSKATIPFGQPHVHLVRVIKII